MSLPKTKSLGHFLIGSINVEVIADNTTGGGTVYLRDNPGPTPSILVGMDHEQWDMVLSVLIHEASEFIHIMDRTRFEPSHGWGTDHAHYTFIFTHGDFTSHCQKLAHFLVKAVPVVSSYYVERTNYLVDEKKAKDKAARAKIKKPKPEGAK